MYYLQEVLGVDKIKQYALSEAYNAEALLSFSSTNNEEAMDIASAYIRERLGIKVQFCLYII